MNNKNFDVATVVKQYHELGSCEKTAEIYGCSTNTIRRYLKANGVALTGWRHPEAEVKHRFKVTPEIEERAAELFQSTQDIKVVCDELGCCRMTLYRILQNNGVQYRNSAWVNSREAGMAAEYYTQGHSVRETADRFNVSKVQINNLVKKRCLTNGKTFRGGANEHTGKQHEEAERRLAEHVSEMGFEYVGGYTNRHGKASIKCCKCGHEFERTVGFLRAGNIVCEECQRRETQARKEEKRRIAKWNADVRQVEKLWYSLTHPPKSHYEKQHDAFLDRQGICEICGKPYTVREYVESCGLKKAQDNGVCSKECRDEKLRICIRASHKGRRDNHRNRAKKFGCEYDGSITLKKLIKRDGLRCAICGGMCDLNDHSWSEYSGPMYPSIDHIIPMSKKGGHTWDNVQVAHIICNSEKGDKVEAVV